MRNGSNRFESLNSVSVYYMKCLNRCLVVGYLFCVTNLVAESLIQKVLEENFGSLCVFKSMLLKYLGFSFSFQCLQSFLFYLYLFKTLHFPNMSAPVRFASALSTRSALSIKSAYLPSRTLNLFHASMATSNTSGRTSKLQQLLSKKSIAQTAKTLKAPSLQSPTSALPTKVDDGPEVSIKPIPTPPPPPGQWGIQMVLSYLRTQKISKCVVFDSYSQNTMNNYIIVCNVPSVRAMYSLAERLVKQARMYKPTHHDQFAAGRDAEGLWSVADMGTILVHILTDAGRSSPAFQRVERRLLNEAKLVPVSKWTQLKDAWVEREERLIANPPPEYKYKDVSLPPPGYYARPYRAPVENRNVEQSDSEGEFGYYDLDEQHKLKVEAMRSGAVGVDSVWSKDAIEFVDVKNKFEGEDSEGEHMRRNTGQKRVARVDDEEDEDEDEDDTSDFSTSDFSTSDSEYSTSDSDSSDSDSSDSDSLDSDYSSSDSDSDSSDCTSSEDDSEYDSSPEEEDSPEEEEKRVQRVLSTRSHTTATMSTSGLGLYDDLTCSDGEVFDITMAEHGTMLDSEGADVDEEEEEAMVFNFQNKSRNMTLDDVEMRLSDYVDDIDKHEEEALGRFLERECVTLDLSEAVDIDEKDVDGIETVLKRK